MGNSETQIFDLKQQRRRFAGEFATNRHYADVAY